MATSRPYNGGTTFGWGRTVHMWIYYERVTYVDESVSPTAAHILFCKAIRSSNQPRWRSVDCNRSLSCSSAAKYVYGLV